MTLDCLDLRRRYGDVVALDGMTMSVRRGRITGFLGPNGAGKTTTMRAILGLTRPDSGTITLDGETVDRARRRAFGYLPEERGLYEQMPIGEQVEFLCRLHGVDRATARARAHELLSQLGLGERITDKVKALSLGNQQRVQLAAALAHEPEVLILDEPFSGLDPNAVDLMADALRTEAARGRIVLFSSHQLDLVEDLCEDVIIVHEGRAVASGPLAELASAGTPRLVVEVGGDHRGEWASALDGVSVSEHNDGTVRLVLEERVDPQSVLRAAQAAGPVLTFTRERRRLSEVFREVTGTTAEAVEAARTATDAGGTRR